MTMTMDDLNKQLMASHKEPRISAMNIHFRENGTVNASVTVTFGRQGYGYGNVRIAPNDERLAGIYELIADILAQAS